MTRSILSKLVVLFAALASGVASAQQNMGIFNNNFCGDPITSICQNLNFNSEARQQRLDLQRAQIEFAAVAMLRGQFSFIPTDVKTMAQVKALPIRFIDRLKVYEKYRENIASVRGFVNWSAEETRLKGKVETIKSYLRAAIDEQIPHDGSALSVNRMMKLSVAIVQPVAGTSISKIADAAHRKSLADAYEQVCGVDGLADNAFALLAPDQKTRYLLICPGKLLAASSGSDEISLRNLLRTLGHEVGHHIDERYFPQTYQKYADCMLNHYAANFNPVDVRTLSSGAQEHIRANNIDVNAADQKVLFHLSEMIGDYWGNQVVAQHLKQTMALADIATKMFVLRESHGSICGSQDEGIHPSGDFRVAIQAGEEPALRAQMGCGDLILRRRACTLKGLHDPLGLQNR